MKEKLKIIAFGIGMIVLGIFLFTVEADFQLMLWGIIPINMKVLGVVGIIIGALSALVGLGSKKE